MSSTSKWSDVAVKDLTFAILMSNNADGAVAVNANWDRVAETMSSWGYTFTKSAMSQHWSKKVVKEFRERHADNASPSAQEAKGAAEMTPKKAASTPRKPRTPKTPASKKRGSQPDDTDMSPTEPLAGSSRARGKNAPSSKKMKHEEEPEEHHSGSDCETSSAL